MSSNESKTSMISTFSWSAHVLLICLHPSTNSTTSNEWIHFPLHFNALQQGFALLLLEHDLAGGSARDS